MHEVNSIRVLRVIHYPVFGGPHNEQLRLDRELQQRGIRTTVLLPDEPGNARKRLTDGGVDVIRMPLHRLRATPNPAVQIGALRGLIPEIRQIRRIITQRSIDVVVIGGLANPHAAIAARLARVPVVWQIVDTRTPAPLRAVMVPMVRRLADALLVDGEALIPFHFGSIPPTVPTVVYFPPVDTKVFLPSPERGHAMRRDLGIPADAPVVGTVANLSPMKGIEYFIRAAAVVVRSRPETWFLVVGAMFATHQTYVERLQAELAKSAIPKDRFIFVGDRADVENVYPAMDVKLITSIPQSEGTTTTAMEAMSCGVPVVATDVGAVREIVEHGLTGFVVPPGDANAIANATLRLLDDTELRQRMAVTGRGHAEKRFDVSVCAESQARAIMAAAEHSVK